MKDMHKDKCNKLFRCKEPCESCKLITHNKMNVTGTQIIHNCNNKVYKYTDVHL